MSGTVAIVLFVVGLVGSIMVHEWGHFATARRFGMRADRFFLGFGPTLWSTQRGETEYGVKALPLGGFVRIRGMGPDDERRPPVPSAVAGAVARGEAGPAALQRLLLERGAPPETARRLADRLERNAPEDPGRDAVHQLVTELIASEVSDTGRVGDLHHRLLRGDEGRFFGDRPAWQRAVVLASGSALHFAQAAALLFIGFLLFGSTAVLPVVDAFAEGEQGTASAAQAAGLEVGDRILAVDGVASDDFAEIRDLIRARPDQPTTITYSRDGETAEVVATPSSVEDPETGEQVGVLGFLPSTRSEPLPADEALYEAFVGPGSFTGMTVGTFTSLGQVFGPEGIASLFTQLTEGGDRDPEGGISIVGAAGAAGSGTAAFGPLFLFVLLANVNVFVGIFNALPLPPLDGGHLAVLGVEQGVNAVRARRGRPRDFSVDPRTVASIAIPVIVLVAAVSLGLLVLDITNPIQLQ